MGEYDKQGMPIAMIPAKPFWAGLPKTGTVACRVTVSLGKYTPAKPVAEG